MRALTRRLAPLLIFLPILAAAQPLAQFSGRLAWDSLEINALVSLDLASAGLKIPAGRTQAEAALASEYPRLARAAILNIPADSSSTVADLIERGDWTLSDAENFILGAAAVPPALSPDLRSIRSAYTLRLDALSGALICHRRPVEIMRTLSPVAAPAYTGIVILADGSLPAYGRKSLVQAVPCLFPKIWDADMNLIYERNMLDTGMTTAVRYAGSASVFAESPSGVSADAAAIVGERPLRIFARALFGINPTDPVIDGGDALQIISREENRRLLREGRVLIILNDDALRVPLQP
jgi:hypothetical protein